MTIKNITNETLSVSLFGQRYELPAGWSLSSEDVMGGEETLRYIAIKLSEKVRVVDENNEVIDFIKCPCCEKEWGQKQKNAENI